jgi:hypothetical protein
VREARNLRTALRNGKALADWTNETGRRLHRNSTALVPVQKRG